MSGARVGPRFPDPANSPSVCRAGRPPAPETDPTLPDPQSPPEGPAEPLILDAIGAPAAVAGVWSAFAVGGRSVPFQGRDWVGAWIGAGAQPEGARLLVIRGRRGGATEFLLPLSVERVGPLRIARRLGGSHASYVLGLWRAEAEPIAPGALRDGLLAIGRAEGIDGYALDAVPVEWEGWANPLAAALPHRPSLDDGHFLRLPASFDALLAARNAGHKRKKVRAKEKLLQAAGDYRISTAASVSEIEATLAAFFAQKSAALGARGIADPFAAPAVRAFYRRLAIDSLGAPEPLLELTRLEAGGAIRAVIGSSLRGGRLYALFASFAQHELTRASPGETLFFRHIEAACGRGIAVYDMGVGSERYKASWCDERVPLVDLRLPVTLAGRLHGAATAAIGGAKAAIRRDERIWPLVKRLRARLGGRARGERETESD